jgi:hypothetical protein
MIVRRRCFAFALAALLAAGSSVHGDAYYSISFNGQVGVTTYPDNQNGPLQPGQARIEFNVQWFSSGAQPEGADAVAFNTDLHLSPSQIVVPKGWTLTPNAVVPGLGTFSWELRAANPGIDPIIDVTINGLGSTAASHFWLPSVVAPGSTATPAMFAFHDYAIDYYQGPNQPWLRVPQGSDESWFSISGPPQFSIVHSAPEPSALVLAGLGLGGWIGCRAWRRRWSAHITA